MKQEKLYTILSKQNHNKQYMGGVLLRHPELGFVNSLVRKLYWKILKVVVRDFLSRPLNRLSGTLDT